MEERSVPPLTVLVVENELLVVEPAVELLRDEGLTVLQATRGSDALRILDENPQIGIAAVDIGLPGMDGNTLVRQARARSPHLKVILMTGYDASAIEIPEDSVTRYLLKPYMPADLFDAIKSLSASPNE